jgi:jasmonate ZIM domain-containing protein
MLIAAAAAAATATKGSAATAFNPPMVHTATVAPAAVFSPVLTRSPSLQSTSVAAGQAQVVADPSSISKLQAGKTTASLCKNPEMEYLFQC